MCSWHATRSAEPPHIQLSHLKSRHLPRCRVGPADTQLRVPSLPACEGRADRPGACRCCPCCRPLLPLQPWDPPCAPLCMLRMPCCLCSRAFRPVQPCACCACPCCPCSRAVHPVHPCASAHAPAPFETVQSSPCTLATPAAHNLLHVVRAVCTLVSCTCTRTQPGRRVRPLLAGNLGCGQSDGWGHRPLHAKLPQVLGAAAGRGSGSGSGSGHRAILSSIHLATHFIPLICALPDLDDTRQQTLKRYTHR